MLGLEPLHGLKVPGFEARQETHGAIVRDRNGMAECEAGQEAPTRPGRRVWAGALWLRVDIGGAMGSETPGDREAWQALAEEMRERLKIRGVLVQMAERGQLIELRCEMPRCFCPKGRGYFDPKSVPMTEWAPNPDHYPIDRQESWIRGRSPCASSASSTPSRCVLKDGKHSPSRCLLRCRRAASSIPPTSSPPTYRAPHILLFPSAGRQPCGRRWGEGVHRQTLRIRPAAFAEEQQFQAGTDARPTLVLQHARRVLWKGTSVGCPRGVRAAGGEDFRAREPPGSGETLLRPGRRSVEGSGQRELGGVRGRRRLDMQQRDSVQERPASRGPGPVHLYPRVRARVAAPDRPGPGAEGRGGAAGAPPRPGPLRLRRPGRGAPGHPAPGLDQGEPGPDPPGVLEILQGEAADLLRRPFTPEYVEDLRRLVKGAGIGGAALGGRGLPGWIDTVAGSVVNAVLGLFGW